eukprot:CAMPEP_0198290848 /NCGR_PEP_ID=MMETSP1449-20131203/8562_1 /TAXON_ID=420275 /ORGANISM="Attheya septentrionalis, Strain CCMP2084" /LENGTH=441 /DNA_ID=CAMNT_0043989397 /DNA_START=1999 /DNA_END=3324 /DNA_ORIENTATION=-
MAPPATLAYNSGSNNATSDTAASDVQIIMEPSYETSSSTATATTQTTTSIATNSQDGEMVKAIWLLNGVAILWGTQHPLIKLVVSDPNVDPAAFSLARFFIGALWTAAYTPNPLLLLFPSKHDDQEQQQQSSREDDIANAAKTEMTEEVRMAWRWGAELGVWMFLGYAAQAIGLEYTTAQRSGFLLYLNVKFVPFFAYLTLGRHISGTTWASALAALTGTGLLMLDNGGSLDSWNVGDLWSIGAAASSAMFILRLEAASEAVPNNSSGLNAACLWVVTFLSFLWTFFNSSSGNNSHAWDGASSSSTDALMSWMSTSCSTMASDLGHVILAHPVELIYLGAVTTALANYIQTLAQRSLTAERASIIYSMDPVYGAIFAYLLLGETLGTYGIYGATIIGVAAATNAFLDLGAKTNDSNDDNDDDNLKMMDSVTDPSIRNESIS